MTDFIEDLGEFPAVTIDPRPLPHPQGTTTGPPPNAHTWVGPWEPDPDAKDIYVADYTRRGWLAHPLTLRPQTGGYRRRRYYKWYVGHQAYGLCEWERRSA